MYAIFFVCFVSCSQKTEKPKEDLREKLENDLKEAKYWNEMMYAIGIISCVPIFLILIHHGKNLLGLF
jgi:hypothetical protein